MNYETKWRRGGKQHVLNVYLKLNDNLLGEHPLWVAIERIANGEPETQVMLDYGYIIWHDTPKK